MRAMPRMQVVVPADYNQAYRAVIESYDREGPMFMRFGRPATPFVYGFLGDVNLFHGRINQGKVNIGEGELDAPGWADASDQAGIAYVRPHDVELGASRSSAASLEARVRHVRTFGPVVRLDLELAAGGRIIEAHVPRDRFEHMAINKGQLVYVSPTSVRVFGLPS